LQEATGEVCTIVAEQVRFGIEGKGDVAPEGVD
jgi:hypothetical protein